MGILKYSGVKEFGARNNLMHYIRGYLLYLISLSFSGVNED